MSNMTGEPDRLREEYFHSVLEWTLIAEYLFANGYLISDLDGLSRHVKRNLMNEAYRVATLRLAEIESESNFQGFFRLPISNN